MSLKKIGKKTTSLCQWEAILKFMISNNGRIDRETFSKSKEFKKFPFNRISAYIYDIKQAGGVVKVFKNGRNVLYYSLSNPDYFKKYFAERETNLKSKNTNFTNAAVPAVSKQIEKLEELNSVQESLVIEEITEMVS